MAKLIVSIGIALLLIFLAMAGMMMVPIKTCSVRWIDRNDKPIQGLYQSCPAELITKRFDSDEYTQAGQGVFRVQRVMQKHPSDGLRPRVSELLVFTRVLDGPVDLDKLKAYHNNFYFNDGTTQFLHGRRIDLTPPVDFEKLRPISPATAIYSTYYVTDETWVVYRDEVVFGADSSTFRHVTGLRLDGLGYSVTEGPSLALDRNAVYFGAQTIEGADPASFEAIVYFYPSDAPPGVANSYPEAWIAFDRSHAWRVQRNEIERFDVTKAQLAALRADLKQAKAAARLMAPDN